MNRYVAHEYLLRVKAITLKQQYGILRCGPTLDESDYPEPWWRRVKYDCWYVIGLDMPPGLLGPTLSIHEDIWLWVKTMNIPKMTTLLKSMLAYSSTHFFLGWSIMTHPHVSERRLLENFCMLNFWLRPGWADWLGLQHTGKVLLQLYVHSVFNSKTGTWQHVGLRPLWLCPEISLFFSPDN